MNDNTETRKIAIDPGFLGFKAAEVIEDTIYTNEMPAVVGIGGLPDDSMLNVGLSKSRAAKPVQISLNGQSMLVGHNVQEYTVPVTRLDYQRLQDGPELRALMYTILASRLDNDHCTSLIFGLPVSVMSKKVLAQQTISRLRSWMIGEHNFSLNGKDYHIEVNKIRGMAQPLGSYFAFGLRNDGEWGKSLDDWDAPIVVGDIGFNTLDLFGIKKGKMIHRVTEGDRLGMHQAAQAIIRDVAKWGVRPSLYEVDLMIKAHVAGEKVLLYHANGSEDIGSLIQVALIQTFSKIIEFIDAHLSGLPYRYLILTGGGALVLKEMLLEHYPYAIILDNPVLANAEGMARYAIREGVF